MSALTVLRNCILRGTNLFGIGSKQVCHESSKVERVLGGEPWTKVYIQENRKWRGAKMARDVKRREIAKDFAPLRLRLVAMKRNNILPPEIQELACQEMEKVPRQSALRQLTPRCGFTSRGHGVVLKWRLSRIVWRDLADNNKLSGVQRAMW